MSETATAADLRLFPRKTFGIASDKEEEEIPADLPRYKPIESALNLEDKVSWGLEPTTPDQPESREKTISMERTMFVVSMKRTKTPYRVGVYLSLILVCACMMSIIAGIIVGRTLFNPAFSFFWLFGGSVILITSIVGLISNKE